MATTSCEHIEKLEKIKRATAHECAECLKIGSYWVHLRTCQICGVTHCCDASPNKHATKHYHSTQHPVICSAEPGEDWLWCYPDEVFFPFEEE